MPFTCTFHSLQIPILANSAPYSFHFLPNSIPCNFLSLQIQVYLSLHFPFLANSALCQNRPLSFHLPFLANAFPLNTINVSDVPLQQCFEQLSLERQFASVSYWASMSLNTANQHHCKNDQNTMLFGMLNWQKYGQEYSGLVFFLITVYNDISTVNIKLRAYYATKLTEEIVQIKLC